MKKKIMTLMMGMLLLLTACGQTGGHSASTMLPVAAVQSATQAIAPVDGKAQEETESLSAEETVEETKDVGDEETPNPTEDAETPSTKAEETPTTPTGEGQSDVPEQPTVPEQAEIPTPQPEPAPSEPEPAPAPVQEPEPTPVPEPEPEPEYEPADRWAAVEAANGYAAAQYGVTTDSNLTMGNSAYRFPASVSADASQETLEAKARDMVDYTFLQLMMQAGGGHAGRRRYSLQRLHRGGWRKPAHLRSLLRSSRWTVITRRRCKARASGCTMRPTSRSRRATRMPAES